MKRRSKVSSQPAKRRRSKAPKPKGVRASAPHGASRLASAGKEGEVARLTRELNEALEQQTATSNVLQVISSSPGDLEPVFATMLEKAVRICNAKNGNIHRWDGDALHLMASHDIPAAFVEARARSPNRPNPQTATGRMIATKKFVHVPDLAAEPAYAARDPWIVDGVELAGVRTLLVVPMLKEKELIGAFTVYREEVRPFSDKQIELVKYFAAQAVIAIENARLLNELRQRTTDLTEALEQQTATSGVLQVNSSSLGNLEPVFGSMLENAVRICDASFGAMQLREDEGFRRVALYNAPPEFLEFHKKAPIINTTNASALRRILSEKRVVQQADLLAEEPDTPLAKHARARTLVVVPLLKQHDVIGAFGIYRQEVRPFTDKQIALVQNFADQAVIAIENARLLNELKQSLDQQTATADVLKVISSSLGALEPVFDTLLENATRLCGASYGNLWLREDDAFRSVALHGPLPAGYIKRWGPGGPLFRPEPGIPLAEAAKTKQPFQIADIRSTKLYLEGNPLAVSAVNDAAMLAVVAVPMIKEDHLIGAIAIYSKVARPFSEKQIELLENFAAQAVIAIENARLLNELRQRTDDLSEALEQQTATSEVLQVISGSRGELQPAFATMLEKAVRICEADFGNIHSRDGDALAILATHSHQLLLKFARMRRFCVLGRKIHSAKL
jgi:GAF domain-containing protein